MPTLTDAESALIDLADDYRTSKHFKHLRATGAALVGGAGPANARVMVIGDAPGAADSGAGVPFSGRSGVVLDQVMALAGIGRADAYLTYVVKYRTPGNRQPTAAEVMRSQKFLRKEWMLVKPLVTIALGETAQAVMEVEGMAHGILNPFWYDPATDTQHLVAAVRHPSFGLRNKKARAWIEKEWTLLGEEVAEHKPSALCPDCHGKAPRGKMTCFCNGTLAF